MKKIFIIFICIYSHLLIAEVNVHSSYLNFNHFTRLENQLNWTASLISNYQINYQASFNNNQNSYFDRSNQATLVNCAVKKDYRLLPLTFSYSYNYEKNGGLPEDTVSVIDRQKQSISLFTEKRLNDYLSVSQELTRSQIKNAIDSYNGNRLNSSINLNYETQMMTFRNNSSYLLQDTFLDKKRRLSSNFDFTFNNHTLNAFSNIRFDNSNQDLYTYAEKTDDLAITDIYNSFNSTLNIFDKYSLNYLHNLSFKKYKYDNSHQKNNSIFDSVFDTYMQQLNNNSTITYGFKYNYYERILSIEDQKRTSLTRMLYLNMLYNDVYVDTLQLNSSILLTKNMHSTPNEFLDNDRQIKSLSLNLKELLNPKLMISTTGSYQIIDEVFISKYLSSNNNVKSTYILQPEITGILNDHFELFNRYQLRATFENYQWNDLINDRYYRKLEYESGMRFKYDPFNSLISEVIYTYITNETADKINNEWLKNNKNIVRIYAVNVNLKTDSYNVIIQPQFKYEYGNYETELLFELDKKIFENSNVKFSFNPMGQTFNSFVWKAYIELYLTY